MNIVEEFFKDYQHTVIAASAIGTWAAVWVALYIANAVKKPKLQAYVEKKILIPSHAQVGDTVDVKKGEDSIAVTIDNLGGMPVYINYFGFAWRLQYPWRKTQAIQNPYYPDFRQDGHIIIEPGHSATIALTNDLEAFRKGVVEGLPKLNKAPKWAKRLIQLRMWTSNGYYFKAKMGKSLRKFILS
tara:strand:+ start:333 stop:890 length:558 start_codon:yes stop_codon:yes gene_type:complete